MENIRETFQVLIRRIGILDKNCCGKDGIGVSVTQSHILYEVSRRNEPSIQEIANTMGIDITTFSRQVQTLTEMGLLKKTPHADDRRVNVLSLTEKGWELENYVNALMHSYYDEIFSHMSDFERETVMRSIRLLNAAMAKSSRCCNPMG